MQPFQVALSLQENPTSSFRVMFLIPVDNDDFSFRVSKNLRAVCLSVAR
jgi:hypothetical protein